MRITVWSSLIFHPKSGIRKFSHLLVFFSSAPCHFVESRILQKLDFSPSKIFPIEFPWAKDATLLQGRKSCLEASWVFMRFSHRGTAVMDFYEKKNAIFSMIFKLFVCCWLGIRDGFDFFFGGLDVWCWKLELYFSQLQLFDSWQYISKLLQAVDYRHCALKKPFEMMEKVETWKLQIASIYISNLRVGTYHDKAL